MRQSLLFQRIAQVAVAILLAAIAAAIHRSFVFSQFAPIRVDVIGAELHSSNHAVKVTLPDLSAFRGQSAVLAWGLRNTRSEQRRVGVLRDGFPNARVVLPPERAVRWTLVLSPEAVRALAEERGDNARSVELVGDADGWALSGLEIRNYHVRLGDRLMVGLPREADAYTSATGFLPVGITLLLFVLVTALGPRSPRRSLLLIGNGLALAAFLVCLTCLILPLISPYKVLLSQPAFWLVASGLFLPGLLGAAPQLPVWSRSILRRSVAIVIAMAGVVSHGFAIFTRHWTRHAVTYERGAALLGLTAIAIAQPIFEVVSNSPEFFAARSTEPVTAVAAVLAICFGAPFALLAIERAIRTVSWRAAGTFYGFALALLSATIAIHGLGQGEDLTPPWDIVLSAGVGVVVAVAAARSRIVRQFLTLLAPAALVVPTLFLLDPSVKQIFLASESPAAVQTIERTPPIVFVVFDELPLNSLVTADGNIDAERYPNFGALAREAYWFREASTVASSTAQAVPAMLSGRYPKERRDAPNLRYYPVNLFTILARHYDIFASLRYPKLCPLRACQYNSAMPTDTVESLLSDLGLVWLHIVLPERLTEQLPPVTDDWADFRPPGETRTGKIRIRRDLVFEQFLSPIDGQSGRLHFIHFLLPHMPFEFVPSGRRYRGPDHGTNVYQGTARVFEKASPSFADTLHQRHLAQVGFVDRLLGDLISRLRQVGIYDEALVVITSDHGASYREGRFRRQPQEHRNLSDILRVPLLIKLPGQRQGEVVDRIVETIDILPTILDVVGANAPLRLDGRSLIDSRVPARTSRTYIARSRLRALARTVDDLSAERAASLERKERRFGRGDLTALYALPGARHLLGTDLGRSAVRSATDVQITIRNPSQFEAVKLAQDPLPIYVGGVLSTSRSAPLTVAVVVNGTVAAVTQSYSDRDAHTFGTLIPETSLREGDNTVTALVVD